MDENITGRVCPSHFIVVIFYKQGTIWSRSNWKD